MDTFIVITPREGGERVRVYSFGSRRGARPVTAGRPGEPVALRVNASFLKRFIHHPHFVGKVEAALTATLKKRVVVKGGMEIILRRGDGEIMDLTSPAFRAVLQETALKDLGVRKHLQRLEEKLHRGGLPGRKAAAIRRRIASLRKELATTPPKFTPAWQAGA